MSTSDVQDPVSPPVRSRFEIWTDRILLVVRVIFLIELGMLLIVLPWRPVWLHNHLLISFPWLRDLLGQGFVRGCISGLGLINIWIAIWDAVHYQEK